MILLARNVVVKVGKEVCVEHDLVGLYNSES